LEAWSENAYTYTRGKTMSARNFKIDRTKKYSNVSVFSSPEVLKITLHSTNVVVFDRKRNIIKLSSGGWRTPTTKTAINNALNQLESLIGQPMPSVFQKKGEWFLSDGTKFQDGMELAIYPLLQELA
jgi:hypothetical protein